MTEIGDSRQISGQKMEQQNRTSRISTTARVGVLLVDALAEEKEWMGWV